MMGHGGKITIINYLREKLHKTLKLLLKRNFASKDIEKHRNGTFCINLLPNVKNFHVKQY